MQHDLYISLTEPPQTYDPPGTGKSDQNIVKDMERFQRFLREHGYKPFINSRPHLHAPIYVIQYQMDLPLPTTLHRLTTVLSKYNSMYLYGMHWKYVDEPIKA